MARPLLALEGAMNINKVMIATDFSDASRFALGVATSVAVEQDAKLVIAHVKSTALVPGADEDDAHDPDDTTESRQLEALAPQAKVTFDRHLLHGQPSTELLRLAEKEGVDLIVMGAQGETGAPGGPLGAVAEAVLREARCAVLTVRLPR
jgi:nucleotide-binding universal stress UspA family protein